jgi:hypothetical protein
MQEHQPKQQSKKQGNLNRHSVPIKPTGGVAVEFFGLMRVENMSADWLDAALDERGCERVWDCQRGSSAVEWHSSPPFPMVRNTMPEECGVWTFVAARRATSSSVVAGRPDRDVVHRGTRRTMPQPPQGEARPRWKNRE